MKGLLYKDFLIIRKQFLRFLLVPAAFFVITLFMGKSLYFSYYAVAILSILPISILGYEENWKWHKYEIILPVNRATLVTEKYLLSLILIIPAVFIEGIVFMLLYDFSLIIILNWICINIFCGMIIPCIDFPLVMRFGYMKGRISNFIIIAVMSASITIINFRSSSGETLMNGTFTPQKFSFLFLPAAAVLFIVSCLLTIKLYLKREF